MEDSWCPAQSAVEQDGNSPVWQPLLDAVGEHLTGTFMWMYSSRLESGRTVHAYKHIITRAYLFLDEDGRAWQWTPCNRYAPQRLDWAIEAALCQWWLLTDYTETDAAAIRAALDRIHQEALRA